ncbi:MAG: hypothetical protein K2F94_00130 [Muribaculaceae bacterium]|nr:hypothetical protein [Muribaculaceae bacterium]MDE6531957.1 hypothetical protein [Muribaculaceae bacterium]
MVYKFKLVSDEVSNFSREIEIDANSSFLQLRNAILDSVNYSKDDIDSFFLCDDEWQRQEEITLEDMGSSSDQDIWIMEDTPLNELIEEEGQKLVFVFDYMTERSFFMEMKEAVPGRTLSDPICTVKRGKAPAQNVDLDEFEKQIDQNAKKQVEDIDIEEFYGDTDFNEDELGSGFDDLSLN